MTMSRSSPKSRLGWFPIAFHRIRYSFSSRCKQTEKKPKTLCVNFIKCDKRWHRTTQWIRYSFIDIPKKKWNKNVENNDDTEWKFSMSWCQQWAILNSNRKFNEKKRRRKKTSITWHWLKNCVIIVSYFVWFCFAFFSLHLNIKIFDWNNSSPVIIIKKYCELKLGSTQHVCLYVCKKPCAHENTKFNTKVMWHQQHNCFEFIIIYKIITIVESPLNKSHES